MRMVDVCHHVSQDDSCNLTFELISGADAHVVSVLWIGASCLPFPFGVLEIQLQTKLNYSWIPGRYNRSECSVSQNDIRRRKWRRICQVKYLRSKFDVRTLGQSRPLDNGKIRIAVGRTANGISGTVTQSKLWRYCEGRRVEPL